MYIRKTSRNYKATHYENYLLVESVSTPKGPRQKVVCSLGDLSPRPRKEWLKLAHKVEDALCADGALFDEKDPEVEEVVRKVKERQRKKSEEGTEPALAEQGTEDDLVSVYTDEVRTELHREAGSVHVGYQFWQRLKLEEILASVGLDERTRALSCAMTLNRLIFPGSEYAMPDWIRRTAINDILKIDVGTLTEKPLYRTMDRLYPNRVMIESKLAEQERTLFNLDTSIYLYDISSTYFEGLAELNEKAARGYSRDKRPDCKQVLVGLVVNKDGFPLTHEVFKGNLQDRQTVASMLDVLDQRIGIREGQSVVVDRGMAFEENLQEITRRKLHYIVAGRQPERDQWLEEFEENEGFQEVIREVSPLNPYQKKSQIRVKMKRGDAETHILCMSSERVEKDRAIRKTKEKRLLADLKKLQKRITKGLLKKPIKIGEAIGRLKERYPRVARYYEISYEAVSGQLQYELNTERMDKANELDGSYLLKTDREDLTAEEVWRIYMMLTRVENAFRNMKSPLAERPIFHQIQQRVETHIFLCVLAYHLLVAIEKTLLDKGVHTSWGTVCKCLQTHQVCTVVLPTDDGSVLKIRRCSTPEPQHVELYRLLDVPSQIVKPKKWWINLIQKHSDGKNC